MVALRWTLLIAALGLTSCPKLSVWTFLFSSSNQVIVRVTNTGTTGPDEDDGVPSLFLSVDSYNAGEVSLSGWSLLPGSSYDRTFTGTRVMGNGRRLTAVVDPAGAVREENEYQHSQTRWVDAPYQDRGDLVVEDLYNSTAGLYAVLRNQGPRATDGTNVVFTVRRDGVIVATPTIYVSPITAGGSRTILLPLSAGTQARYAVIMSGAIAISNGDTTNDGYAEFLPAGPDLSAYHDTMEALGDSLIWEDAAGLHTYASWPASVRSAVDYSLTRMMEGKDPFPTHVRPYYPVPQSGSLDSGYYTTFWARYVYGMFVAHSIWVEVNHQVPWSVMSMTAAQRALLFDSRGFFRYRADVNAYRLESGTSGYVSPWSPIPLYRFARDLDLVGIDQEATIYAAVDWVRSYVRHLNTADDTEEMWDWPNGFQPPERVLFAKPGQRHVSNGCWGTTGLLKTLLRTVNVPVQQGFAQLSSGNHSRVVFPTIGRTMIHSDDPYSGYTRPYGLSTTIVPTSEIVITDAEFRALIEAPALDCVGSICNSVPVQASVNHTRHLTDAAAAGPSFNLAHDYLSDAAALRATLTGRPAGAVAPYYTSAQVDAMFAAIEEAVVELGEGDRARGRSLVMQAQQAFLETALGLDL